MKHQLHTVSYAALLFGSTLMMATAQTSSEKKAEAHAHAEAKAEGNNSFVQKQTVTSDGTRTIKKTTTIRNGVEETITEITDAQGNVIREGGEPASPDKETQPKPADKEQGPWLGVKVVAAPSALRDQLDLKNNEGVVIEALAPNSPASKAGLRVNDILLKLNQTPLSTPEDLRAELDKHQVGETVYLEILRKGERSTEEVVLEENTQADDDAPKNDNPDKGHPPQHDGDREMKVEVKGGTSVSGLDDVLNNPQVSEEFKKNVREIKERMEKFQKEHAVPPLKKDAP